MYTLFFTFAETESMRRLLAYSAFTLLVYLLLCGFCCKNSRHDTLKRYSSASDVQSLIYVDCTGGSNAVVTLYQKNEKGRWQEIFETEGYIGRNGLASPEGTKREGDGKTPEGDIRVVSAFGIKENPGTSIPYVKVDDDWWGCDEDCEYYNTIIKVSETGHQCKGEHLALITPAYNYSIVTSYNEKCERGMGSLIFFHCIGTKPYTGGCVAVPEERMVEVLRHCDLHTIISIHPNK